MNDPCGPMYDPTRDEYHIFYQAFPQHTQFGNTSWGHAKSKDLVYWTDVGGWENKGFLAIEPSNYSVPSYDWLGAFSGGAYAVNLKGEADGNLTLMYSGDVLLPDNWQRPYELGPPYATETQNIATSSDGGQTWQKWEGNPRLNGQPGGWNVTGLRDPVFAPNAKLDKILGHNSSKWYLVMGSGIRDVGPRIPLFSADSHDLTNWTFEGALWEPAINTSFGGDRTKTGNYGANFELAGFYDEVEKVENGGDGETTHWIVSFGAEGYADEWHPLAHWSLFVLGDVHPRGNGSAEFETKASGVLDWGNSYAMNAFHDTKHDRRVLWGWSDEDLNNTAAVVQQGYQGSLGLPRELYIKKFHGVHAPIKNVVKGPEIWQNSSQNGTYSVVTVAQRPLPEVVNAIEGEKHCLVSRSEIVTRRQDLPQVNSSHFHLQTTIGKAPSTGKDDFLGVQLRASPNQGEYTEVRYYAFNSSVVLDRTHSTLLAASHPDIGTATFVGHFEPFTYANGTENIVMDFFVDGSLLEIFINDRFAMTSRIYPSRADALGAALVVKGEAQIENVSLWEMEANVWPERPLNASSPMMFDPYYETHITFENPYLPTGYELYVGY
ncbi:glycoside hydrolase family 32 protein [Zasmidium cellare ATCC 36951]|uniref:Glycoside hydrolase family 32 protein n=1 Tax=Zasmidium cellare ATCC 36951 TaxID=1080233 RepID=A0A6A6BY46_ZASCE|nr:glycoside hydrolase family 32 protein [Zasmidium cellare ATCC 36951]KAF2159734.1 glycoside hydrolase family 32 protein [Zasmidium cellare ATCC 36951]